MFNYIIFHFLLILMTHDVRAEITSCQYGTDARVFYAYCSKMTLEEFPTNLKENIEGLYLSYNQFEYLSNDTFKHHSSIKFLYLDHNKLEPESHFLAPLTKLEILDLSYNSHLNVSDLYLPKSVKKLYLDGVKSIKTHLPISSLSELGYLSLSKCKLDQIPSFGGSLLSLKVLNLTGNKLENFKIDNFAFLCQLEELYISNDTSIRSNCECLRLKAWMDTQKITGSKITCDNSKSDEDCDLNPSASFLEIYRSCEKYAIVNKYLSWFLIGCAGFVVCFSCIMLYICCNKKGFFCYVIYCKCFRH